MPNSRMETLLTALINGETVDFTPRSRAEQYLKNCIEACGCDGLPAPRSRLDALLYALADKISQGGGSGSVIEVSTASEMDEILSNATDADIGKVYYYIGESTDTYEQGALYMITQEE